jgi:hypothetical protein
LPYALVRSLKRRHRLPAIALLVSLLLRVSIALSISFLTVVTKNALAEVPVRVLDTFKELKFEIIVSSGYNPREITDYRPFYIPKAIYDLNISYPKLL